MTSYPRKGRGQGHMTHSGILHPLKYLCNGYSWRLLISYTSWPCELLSPWQTTQVLHPRNSHEKLGPVYAHKNLTWETWRLQKSPQLFAHGSWVVCSTHSEGGATHHTTRDINALNFIMIVGLLGIKQKWKLGIPFNQHFNFPPSPLDDLNTENKTINTSTINSYYIIYRHKYNFICKHNLATNETAGFQSHDSKFLGQNRAVTKSEQVSRTRKKSCENAWHTNGVSRVSFSYEFLGRRTWVVCHGL